MIDRLKRRIYSLPFLARSRQARALAKAVPVTFSEGFTIRTFPWVFNDHWERAERAMIGHLMPTCDLFIDVGAHHGFYAAMADRVGKPTLAIEPEPANCRVLRVNAEGRRITVINAALGAQKAQLTLYGDGDVASLHSKWQGEAYFKQTVPVVTLDSLTDSHQGRLLIKVDVEGFEDAVLHGASQTLSRPSTWIIETMAEMPAGGECYAFRAVFDLMRSAGFEGSLIQGSDTNWLFERAGG